MSEKTGKKNDKPQTAKEAREARMKAALRSNLQRRKGQARVRATAETEISGQEKE